MIIVESYIRFQGVISKWTVEHDSFVEVPFVGNLHENYRIYRTLQIDIFVRSLFLNVEINANDMI